MSGFFRTIKDNLVPLKPPILFGCPIELSEYTLLIFQGLSGQVVDGYKKYPKYLVVSNHTSAGKPLVVNSLVPVDKQRMFETNPHQPGENQYDDLIHDSYKMQVHF